MTMLHAASNQWATRPADQRFWTVEDLHAATLAHKQAAREAVINNSDLRIEAVDNQMQLVGRSGSTAQLTNWAFRQLCARASAPSAYLADLPTTLAIQNLNHGLKANLDQDKGTTSVLLHENGGYFARAVLSEKYTRIWNSDVTERLLDLSSQGWATPPARPVTSDDIDSGVDIRRATAAQASLSLTVKEGDPIGPAGLYASFEDMFAFMIHPERIIEDGSEGGLMRGFFVWNSEVGKSSFNFMKFMFRGVCGNHIVWDAKDVTEISVRHVGSADVLAFDHIQATLTKYADESASEDEARIVSCQKFKLGKTTDDVLDLIFAKRILPRRTAQQALAAHVEGVDGDPTTAWGFAQGVTRLSQCERNADKRVDLDLAASKILRVAF